MINLNGRTVLITGGTGTFGVALVRELLANQRPEKIVIYSRGEHRQAEMAQEFASLDEEAGAPLRFFVGDVRDRDRLLMAMRDVSVVFHAAALKRVETCEYNPQEAIETNVNGSRNLVDVAIRAGVERVIGLSSDKAAAPITLYGYTKGVMERLFSAANALSGERGTRFSCVRYGNVLGSNGSVLGLFKERLKAGKPLRITQGGITRFWWTAENAVRFTLAAADEMSAGEVFIPHLSSASVSQLAWALCHGSYNSVQIPMRPGERRYELLLTDDEATRAFESSDFVVIPPLDGWQCSSPERYERWQDGGFKRSYSSDDEEYRMNDDEVRDMIARVSEYEGGDL